MKPVIDSNQDKKKTSRERFNLVILHNLFPNKPWGHMIQICAFAKYKLLDNLQDPLHIVKTSSVKSAVGVRVNNGSSKTVLFLKHFSTKT